MLDITHLTDFAATATVGFPRLTTQVTPLPVTKPRPALTVTWQVTRKCNLNCMSCLSDSRPVYSGSELSTLEGMALIRDLAGMQVPRLLFAGGEPLLRPDVLDLIGAARARGIEPSLRTNGTLLSRARSASLRRAGLHSVSILLEGTSREVDEQRRVPVTFEAIVRGCDHAAAAGLGVEVRVPLNRRNYSKLAHILEYVEQLRVSQVVFAHLIYAGRGNSPRNDLTPEQKRRALDLILERAEDFRRRGVNTRISTDENDVDRIYFYLRLVRRDRVRAAAAYGILRAGGAAAHGAGLGVAGIGAQGDVHPDPYWTDHRLGNVREKSFSEIWERSLDPLLLGLRHRLPLLKGSCAVCRWKYACGGSLRVRADEFYGDPWMTDPACYLTDNEISKEGIEEVSAMEEEVLLEEQAA
jgi:radical SAM protein with 4Fe4S-binding SPASM domain